jgi:hypothetical protein
MTMDSQSLAPGQAKPLSKALFPLLNYLLRLKTRMEAVGFLPDDKLYGLVRKAYEDVHALSVEVHYLSCGGGVNKPAKE